MTADPRSWWEDDPERLAAEIENVRSVAPDLVWTGAGAGRFDGPIPVWPFDREEPTGLVILVPRPPLVRIKYTHAFPAVPPAIIAIEPQPPGQLRGFTAFHVLPDGALCLLRDASQWNLRSETSELILKASAWFLEFALLAAGRIERMTVNGIVNDRSLDPLFANDPEQTQ